MLLFLSSLKLPYFVIGLGILLVERCWKAIGLCFVMFVATFAVGAVWSSPAWMSGYLSTIGRYITGNFSEGGFFWGGFHSGTPTWQYVSRGFLTPEVTQAVQWGARILGAVLMFALFVRGPSMAPSQRVSNSLRILLGTYLVFSSYLGNYEQILLLLCPLVALATGRYGGLKAMLVLLLVFGALSEGLMPPLASFLCKVLVLVL